MNRHLATITAALALSTALASSANAAIITINPITGTWQGVIGGGSVTTNNNGTANPELRWGTPVPAGGGKSGYDFDANPGVPLNVPLVANGATGAFALGNFSHLNFPIAPGTSITEAQLKITYGVAVDGVFLNNFDAVFDFTHEETPNSSPCAYSTGPGDLPCPDRVTVAVNTGASQSFSVDGIDYLLNVTGFTVGGVHTGEFVTREGAVSTAQLDGTISAKHLVGGVPEPGTWAMMLLGFGAIGGMMRSRRHRVAVRYT